MRHVLKLAKIFRNFTQAHFFNETLHRISGTTKKTESRIYWKNVIRPKLRCYFYQAQCNCRFIYRPALCSFPKT